MNAFRRFVRYLRGGGNFTEVNGWRLYATPWSASVRDDWPGDDVPRTVIREGESVTLTYPVNNVQREMTTSEIEVLNRLSSSDDLNRLAEEAYERGRRMMITPCEPTTHREPVGFCAECTVPIFSTDSWMTTPDRRVWCGGCGGLDDD